MNVEEARFNMIHRQIRPWGVPDPGVLALFRAVRREDFVPEGRKALAFADLEIPLKLHSAPGQVMLPPRVEGRILQEIGLRNADKVLEIGAGSGHMAALLAAKAEFVHAVEIDPDLALLARRNLQAAGMVNASVDLGDASQGWDIYAPYDVIVISGALPALPEALPRLLKVGGRLAAFVGEAPAMQARLVRRLDENAFAERNLFETVVAPLANARRREKFVF
ncbi:MAG: protein-L-isoaspartate O-methyltransferase [Candidatus Accumulibacter sp.]|nr:protein-L-isoaspartate O-methyltransferase [Accumulibacter sp.]